jgi:hypothetical protein
MSGGKAVKRKLNVNRFWWIWKGNIGRGMWPLSKKAPKSAVGPFGTKREAQAFKDRVAAPEQAVQAVANITDDEEIIASTKSWAADSQMTPPFAVGEVVIVRGTCRFSVTVTDSKSRAAICAFKADGSRDVFERTDRIAGGG